MVVGLKNSSKVQTIIDSSGAKSRIYNISIVVEFIIPCHCQQARKMCRVSVPVYIFSIPWLNTLLKKLPSLCRACVFDL